MRKNLPPLLAAVPLAVLLALSPALGQKSKGPTRIKPIVRAEVTVKAGTPTQQDRRVEAFHTVWRTINEYYFDKSFGGLNWKSVENEYEPKVRAAQTDAQFHLLLAEMIKKLGKSHLSVIIPEYFERIEAAKKQARAHERQLAAAAKATSGTSAAPANDDEDEDLDFFEGTSRYGIGVELRMLDGQIVVSRVEAKSGADLAGLKPGFVIQKINNVSVGGMIDQAVISGSSKTEIGYLFPIQLVDSFLNGSPDTSVHLSVLDASDAPRELTVPRMRLAGETISISDNLPEQFLRYEAKSLTPKIGYVKFSAFAVPVIGKFCDSLTELRDKKALIIDLRGNLGGIIASMIGLSGMMIDKPVSLGNVVSRSKTEPFPVAPKAKQFKGRVVLLVDELSMSAAEMFTAGMQGNKRAIVVGAKTGGQSLPSVWTKLSTGAVLVYPIADFITPKGVSLEGLGLEPDVKVELSRKSLLSGVDNQLARAESVALDNSVWPAAVSTPTPKADAEPDLPPPPMPAPRMNDGKVEAPPPAAKMEMRLDRVTKLGAADAPKPASDAKSLKVLADFAAAAGGVEAFRAVNSYEAKGTMKIGTEGQAQTSGTLYTARQFPDKYLMTLETPSMGELRETYNGKTSLLQTDAGIDRPVYQPGIDGSKAHLFAPVFNLTDPDYHKNLKYEGEFEIEGRKRQIISGRDYRGFEVGMSFDSETKMLVTYSLPGALYTLTDYRKTGSIMLPYSIDMSGISKTKFESVTLNPKLDPVIFEKKEKCFDKAL